MAARRASCSRPLASSEGEGERRCSGGTWATLTQRPAARARRGTAVIMMLGATTNGHGGHMVRKEAARLRGEEKVGYDGAHR